MDKESAQHVWGASPAGTTFGEGFAPGTREFFEKVLEKRSNFEMPWLFAIVPFSSFGGRKVLELGCGAGYDAFEFCRHGAVYSGIDITPENIERTRKHLSFYGYQPYVAQGDAEDLQFEDESFNVVYSNGVLHHTPDIEQSFREAYRVLEQNGEFWVILYHKNSIFYRVTVVLVDHVLHLGFRKRSLKERRSMIEYTTSSERPLVNVYSRKALRRLLKAAGFKLEIIKTRKLVREEFPTKAQYFLRPVPQAWLDFIGKRYGWYLIAKARKA